MNTELFIIRETLDLFRLYGIRALALEDIARFLKLTPGVVKKYFPTKEQLLLKCVRYRLSQEEVFKYTDDRLPDILINFAEAYPELYRGIDRRCCMEIRKYYNAVFNFLYRYFDFFALACQYKVEEGITNGYIRRTISPNVVYVFFRNYLIRLFEMEANPLENDLDSTYKILAFTREIVTVKGRIYIEKELKKRNYDEVD